MFKFKIPAPNENKFIIIIIVAIFKRINRHVKWRKNILSLRIKIQQSESNSVLGQRIHVSALTFQSSLSRPF